MITIRGGKGLGDAMYLRSAVELLLRTEPDVKEHDITVCCDYPQVFHGLFVTVAAFRRTGINRLAHYSIRKGEKTNQWDDVCIQAGLKAEPMRITWSVRNKNLVDEVRRLAAGRKVILCHGGRIPMGRTDGFGAELAPLKSGFDDVLRCLSDCYVVRVGKGNALYPLSVGIDLTDLTTVSDLFDLAVLCDGIVGQCSYAVPLAEALDKPAIFVWSAKGLRSKTKYVQQITPAKILSKRSSLYVVDDWHAGIVGATVSAFRCLL